VIQLSTFFEGSLFNTSIIFLQFYPRPGTAAAKMKLLPTNVGKSRTKKLTKLFQSYEPYKGRIGFRCSILVTDISHDKEYFVGHNEYYEQVINKNKIFTIFNAAYICNILQILVPKDDELMGKMVNVEIVSTTKFSMIARILDGAVTCFRPNKNEPLKMGQVSGLQKMRCRKSYVNFLAIKCSAVFLFIAFAFKMFQYFHFSTRE